LVLCDQVVLLPMTAVSPLLEDLQRYACRRA
jgi:hypothetical protein